MMEEIREILIDTRPEYDFLDEVDFIESGMLDSFDVLTLVTELEEKFNIRINGSDILPENFCSIKAIENLIVKSGGIFE
ncbi:acyl carrier protein [Aliarcobacter skirrowii]|nr:acyl carrier protein [Aliarcobacter skirrowii]